MWVKPAKRRARLLKKLMEGRAESREYYDERPNEEPDLPAVPTAHKAALSMFVRSGLRRVWLSQYRPDDSHVDRPLRSIPPV